MHPKKNKNTVWLSPPARAVPFILLWTCSCAFVSGRGLQKRETTHRGISAQGETGFCPFLRETDCTLVLEYPSTSTVLQSFLTKKVLLASPPPVCRLSGHGYQQRDARIPRGRLRPLEANCKPAQE